MNNKPWYKALFENYARQYDQEDFTKGTLGECDFIEQELSGNKKLGIIDVGCGTGRHAIELSKRGYNVTGIDLSENQLERAREKALKAGVKVDFQRQDARQLPFKGEFDVAIMLCEGGFPLMETDEMNFEILKNVTNSLKTTGKLIFTTLNGLFPLYNSVEKFHEDNDSTGAVYKGNSFDLMTFRDHNVTTFIDDDGIRHELDCNERYYVPSEITWLLKTLGYRNIGIFAARLGVFSRNDSLTTGDYEMLVIAER